MNARFLIAVLTFMTVSTPAGSMAAEMPGPLAGQIERVVELLRDPYAVEYPDARMTQSTRAQNDELITLVVFTIEGFGGGNNHTQYLAAFESETGQEQQVHYRLLDVIPIGGKGWRAVQELNARTTVDPRLRETSFVMDVLNNGPNDPMNFPGTKAVVRVVLKDGRLSEVATRGSAGR